jgi:hypothetical protein
MSIPFPLGILQGTILEMLPKNLFTVTRAQVGSVPQKTPYFVLTSYQIEQLKSDNVVCLSPTPDHASFQNLVERYSGPLKSLHDMLPTYL